MWKQLTESESSQMSFTLYTLHTAEQYHFLLIYAALQPDILVTWIIELNQNTAWYHILQ